MMINKEDIITCESYKGICDSVYKVGDEPQSGVIHVNMEELMQFFEFCREYPERKFVVVSSCSDFGVCYQQEQPVYGDLVKWARMCVTPEVGYNGITIGPRCDLDRCRHTDKYSVKCYAYTAYTFNEIPGNVVKWFTTNLQIKDEICEPLPFGVPANAQEDIHNQMVKKSFDSSLPKKALYINWTNYTYERALLESFYSKRSGELVTVVGPNKKPYKEYLAELSEHWLCLSPSGNGLDCYRNLEALYLGVSPIFDTVHLVDTYASTRCFATDTMYLSSKDIKSIVSFKYQGRHLEDMEEHIEKAKLSYWKGKIDGLRSLLA